MILLTEIPHVHNLVNARKTVSICCFCLSLIPQPPDIRSIARNLYEQRIHIVYGSLV